MISAASPLTDATEAIVSDVIDAAYHVHRKLGPGLLESVYETCLCYELTKRNLPWARQSPCNIRYDELEIEAALRIDILVAGSIVIELKAVEEMIPLYEAQLLTYLKLTGHRIGLLINFNSVLFKHGIKRLVL